MKIVKLKAENIKKLVAIEIAPAGNVVKITGKNGAGKTSVLDSIFWALAGTDHIQAEPVRKGQKKGAVELDLGDIIVRRTFTNSGSALVVENKEGARFKSPQTMLDGLIGRLSFDPLAFARLDERAQFETIRRLVPGVDFDALDEANRQDYDKRTTFNRQAKEARNRAAGIPVPSGLPDKRIDELDLVQQLEKAGQHNADIELRRNNRERMRERISERQQQIASVNTKIEELEAKIKQLVEESAQLAREAQQLQQKLDAAAPLPEVIDTMALTRKIAEAREVNQTLNDIARRNVDLAAAEDAERQAQALTVAIEKRQAEGQAAIAAAKLPVEGLGIGDGLVLYNGIPLDQASSAEQLRVSLAIAMALNPTLRVIRISDASLLDTASLAIMEQMATASDYQVWLEMVDESGNVGIVIEDGHVAAVNAPTEARA